MNKHGLAWAISVIVLTQSASAQQALSPEQQAETVLVSAQKAQAAGDTDAASARFAEVVQKFGNTRQALSAKLALGLLQINRENPDFAKAIENLNGPANDGSFTERGSALYHLGMANRGQGLKELQTGKADAARTKFAEAQQKFNTARDWYAGQKQDEWSARCRCDQAEMELRTGKVKEARSTTEPFTKDEALARSKQRRFGLYLFGLACFLDGDTTSAGRTLNQLAPFSDPHFGLHARYLVGRILHLSGETAEATVNYETVLQDYEKARTTAADTVQKGQKDKTHPQDWERLKALATGPAPEFVGGANYHLASLKAEAGKFGEALEKFNAFLKGFDKDALVPDAQLRIGYCQVQLKQFGEAEKTLAALVEKTPKLADEARFWLGKARFGLALASDADRESKVKAALETIRQAVEQAKHDDANLKARRYEMMMELGDALQTAGKFKDAAGVYEQLWNSQGDLVPARREEVLNRLGLALGNAGDFQRSQERIEEFHRIFPQSTLTASSVFRSAENSYAQAVELSRKNDQNRTQELKERLDTAIGAYKQVIEKHPDYERIHHARLGLGVCLAQVGKFDDATKALEAIPAQDRNGDLVAAAFLLADLLIRQTPTTSTADALEENRMREKLNAAVTNLESYISGNPKAANTPAALLKLAYCQKRLASTLADQNERNQTYQKARESLEKLEKEFPNDPARGLATLEKAKIKAVQGDRGGAMNDLHEFANAEATKKNPSAPLALLHLATLKREENKPEEAANILAEARKRYESQLAGDPERAEWVALFRYHHAAALFEQKKISEARKLFEEVRQQSPGKPMWAEAALRIGQCRIAEGRKKLQAGFELQNQAGNDDNKKNKAWETIEQGRQELGGAYDELQNRCHESRDITNSEARARMIYEAAWAARDVALHDLQRELEQARKEAQEQGKPQPKGRGDLRMEMWEERMFETYRKLADEFADMALSVEARLEWAEQLAERQQHEDIVKVLKDALEKEPSDRPVNAEILERMRLRLGGSLFVKKDYAGAASQFESVAANEKTPHRAQAYYRAGECYAAAADFAKAIECLKWFRDKPEYHTIGGISDRALMRLGHAQAGLKKTDEAKATFETWLNRFGKDNPLAPEARYGLGLIQAAKGQWDEAMKSFDAVIASTQAEVAAKAQLQVGLCRMGQKKYSEAANAFLLVTYTYDYPELTQAAVLEAARAFLEDKKPADAERLLKKVLKDTPATSELHKAALAMQAALKR